MHLDQVDLSVIDPAARASAQPVARLLTLDDLPQLLELEHEKWDDNQAADARDMAARIASYPQLSIGAFQLWSGRILASTFLKPIAPDFWRHAADWSECVDSSAPHDTRSLFGISLSGRDDGGVDALSDFLWPHLAALGWREVYLGSPIPGWAQWQQQHPDCSVETYVARRRSDGLPCDPQLRYYHRRGFKHVVCVKRDYFPHERSQDHGVIVRRDVMPA